jgi:hypothetical protein
MLRAPEKGYIAFGFKAVIVKFPSQTSDRALSLEVPCTALEWQRSSAEKVCTSPLPLVSTLEDLYIFEFSERRRRWQDDVENTLWLELLRSFVAVKNLYISEELVPNIAPAPAGTCRGQNDRSVAHPGEYFLGGISAVGTSPGRHRKVCCRSTAHESSCSSFPLGQEFGTE